MPYAEWKAKHQPEMTPEQIAVGREAKKMLQSEALQTVFKSLEDAYIAAWRTSDIDSNGQQLPIEQASVRRGTLWVKLKCLEDLQFELRAYSERAEFAEMGEIT